MLVVQSPPRPVPAPYSVAVIAPDHSRAPVLERLQRARKLSFSTPGHKRGAGADPGLLRQLGAGVFESDIWLATADLREALREAQALAADAWGAERTYFLVNGSSSGNHAFLLAALRPGDEVVVARDAHTSILTALILSGARPVCVTPRFDRETGVSLGVSLGDLAATLDGYPAARLVVLVSPNYYGIAIDVPAAVAVAHARGVPVYVDEAWGPHFRFHPALPISALESGADAAVTSAHKMLGCLSQGSLLHLQGPRADRERVAAAVAMTQTTSPLLPILAAIDASRRQMALHGQALLERTLNLARDARQRIDAMPGLSVLDGKALGVESFDPTRLVINVQGLGLTGFDVERVLRSRLSIMPEMSDQASVVCLVTVGDSPDSIRRLVTAFKWLATERRGAGRSQATYSGCALGRVVAAGPQIMSPREAFFAPARAVPLCSAVGEVAAELLVPYPPGVPIATPGELITADKVAYLQDGLARGMVVRGASDDRLATVRVVA